jgi:hypothetical protein
MFSLIFFWLAAGLASAANLAPPGAASGSWCGDQPPSARGPVAGFVISVTGTWELAGSRQPLRAGAAVPAGAVLQLVSGEAMNSEIRIALTQGRETSSCSNSSTGERRCAPRLEIPRGSEQPVPLSDRVLLALQRSFSSGPRRLVATISRGILAPSMLQSAPLMVDGDRIDLAGLFIKPPNRSFDIRFSSIPNSALVFRCVVRPAEGLWCRPAEVSGKMAPAGGLFQLSVEDPAWTGGALLVSRDAFPAVDREFRQTLSAISAWETSPPRTKGAREVVLELLAEKR